MERQNKQVLKLLLKKIASSDLLLLSEAAEKIGVSEKYLENLIRLGQLKSFKVDDYWFVEENWLSSLKENLRNSLQTEINASDKIGHQSQHWVRPLKKVSFTFPKADLLAEFSRLAWCSVSLSALTILLAVCFLPLVNLSSHRYELAGYFITGTDRVYGAPLSLIKSNRVAFSFKNKINDEVITKFIRQIIRPPKSNRAGQVAGEVEAVKPTSWLLQKTLNQ